MGEFAVSIEHSKAKSVLASGGLRPLTLRPGALPPDPRYRLTLHALAMPPLCQILNTPLLQTNIAVNVLYDTILCRSNTV